MKNPRSEFLILLVANFFLAFVLIAETAEAQSKTAAKPAKTAPKPVSKAAENKKTHPQESSQVIVSATNVRVRREPAFEAETIQQAKIGAIFPLLDQNEKWFKIKILSGEKEETAWIAKSVSQPFSAARRAEIYAKIADKYLKQSSVDFVTATQIFGFLTAARKEINDSNQLAGINYKRLLMLSAALKKVEFGKAEENPYKDFLAANESEVIYSEPSGQWLVRSQILWDLHEKNKNAPAAEEIAWTAAQNPIPGECEGYINCYLYLLRSTEGEYLNFYPNGKYSRQALKNITSYLEPIAADAKEKTVYYSANDISDRADFNKYLTELRAIVSKVPFTEKSKTLQQIKQIAEAHR
jgi:hypothetical protein